MLAKEARDDRSENFTDPIVYRRDGVDRVEGVAENMLAGTGITDM
jgi:hypothetical protein